MNKIHSSMAKEIQAILNAIESYNKTNVNRAVSAINKVVDSTYDETLIFMLAEIKEFLLAEISWNSKYEQVIISEDDKESLALATLGILVLGKTLQEHTDAAKRSLKNNILVALRNGMVNNYPASETQRVIRGSKGLGYKDGLMPRYLNGLFAISDTVIQGMLNKVRMSIWEANTKKYVWLSVLDSRTTSICRARSNKVYVVGKGPIPPAHFRCRSTIVAQYAGMEIPESYGSWLRKQPLSSVQDILGKRKADLFLSGKVSLERFVTPSGRELTLKELRERS